jgi:hypothetical protein
MSKAFLAKLIYKRTPQFLSYIFHPLIMPTLGVYVILNSGTYISLMPTEAKNIVLTVVFTCTFCIPLAFLPFFYYGKITKSLVMEDKNERFIPLIVTALLYYLSYYLLHRMVAPGLIQAFLLASTIAVCVNTIVTSQWKISAHMIGIGGVIGLIIAMSVLYRADMMLYLMIAIFLGGLTGFARLSLNAHTPLQVYGGLATGFLVIVMTMSFL